MIRLFSLLAASTLFASPAMAWDCIDFDAMSSGPATTPSMPYFAAHIGTLGDEALFYDITGAGNLMISDLPTSGFTSSHMLEFDWQMVIYPTGGYTEISVDVLNDWTGGVVEIAVENVLGVGGPATSVGPGFTHIRATSPGGEHIHQIIIAGPGAGNTAIDEICFR